MRNLNKIIAIFAAILMLLSFAACGDKTDSSADNGSKTTAAAESKKASIIGSWEYESGGYTYTFNEDGTGTYDTGGAVMKFTYEATDTELSITYEGNTEPMVLEYTLDGDTLNVKDSFGSDTIYNRK